MERKLQNSEITLTKSLKIFFTRINEPISTKPGTKHPLLKRIQDCSNVGPRPFPRADYYELAKIH